MTSTLLRLQEFYNKKTTSTGPAFSLRMERVVEIAREFPVSSLLDVGSGDGEFTNAFAKSCKSSLVIGVDLSRALVKASSKYFSSLVGTFFPRLPIQSESFDAVLCSELIEHTIDPDNLLLEIRRVLRPEGLLFLTTPNLASWFNRLSLMFGYQPHFSEVSLHHNVGKLYLGGVSKGSDDAIGGHLRLYTPRALNSLLKIHGFNVIVRHGAGIGFENKSTLPFPVSIFDKIVSRRHSVSAFLIYVCRKEAGSKTPVQSR